MPREIEHVTAVVVTYNSVNEVGQLLDSLPDGVGKLRLTTIVVDNGSRDGTRELLAARTDIRAVDAGANLGFAGGINIARNHVPGDTDALAVINPDVVVLPRSLELLATALQDATLGVVVPRILSPQGDLFHSLRREPTVAGALGEGIFGAHWSSRPMSLTDTLRDPADYSGDRDVAWASGAAMMIAADCDAAVGPWDERFFLYSEETDYARRVRRAGYRIRYVCDAVVTHVGGASGTSTQLEALQAVNKIRDYEAHHGRPAAAAFRLSVSTRHLLRSYRAPDREILRVVASRSSWRRLPSATRTVDS